MLAKKLCFVPQISLVDLKHYRKISWKTYHITIKFASISCNCHCEIVEIMQHFFKLSKISLGSFPRPSASDKWASVSSISISDIARPPMMTSNFSICFPFAPRERRDLDEFRMQIAGGPGNLRIFGNCFDDRIRWSWLGEEAPRAVRV